jgi:hypothetical protein
MSFFFVVQTYLGTYTLVYVYWSLHTNLSLPRNYLPSFSLLFKVYIDIVTISPFKAKCIPTFPMLTNLLICDNPFDHHDQPSPHILDIIHDHHPPLLHLQPHTISSFITPYLKQVDKRPSISRALKTQLT